MWTYFRAPTAHFRKEGIQQSSQTIGAFADICFLPQLTQQSTDGVLPTLSASMVVHSNNCSLLPG